MTGVAARMKYRWFPRLIPLLLAPCIAVAIAATGCIDRSRMPSFAPTASPASSEIPRDQVAAWMLFRSVYGLRADAEWAVAVANDPRSVGAELGVPLLPSELEQVAAANSSAQRLSSIARSYGNRFPKAFGGSWLEGPVVVLAFDDDLELHRAEVTALFGNKVDVRSARYSLAELHTFLAAVNEQGDWFSTIGAELHGADVNEPANTVEVHYLGPGEGIAPLISARFAPSSWLTPVYDGPLPWTGPVGNLELTVVDSRGRPIAVECLLYTTDPRVRHEDLRDFPDGKCVFQSIPAVEWSVEVTYDMGGEEKTVTKNLVVPAGGTVRSKLTVSP